MCSVVHKLEPSLLYLKSPQVILNTTERWCKQLFRDLFYIGKVCTCLLPLHTNSLHTILSPCLIESERGAQRAVSAFIHLLCPSHDFTKHLIFFYPPSDIPCWNPESSWAVHIRFSLLRRHRGNTQRQKSVSAVRSPSGCLTTHEGFQGCPVSLWSTSTDVCICGAAMSKGVLKTKNPGRSVILSSNPIHIPKGQTLLSPFLYL